MEGVIIEDVMARLWKMGRCEAVQGCETVRMCGTDAVMVFKSHSEKLVKWLVWY